MPKEKGPALDRKGFSLIEVVIAMGITLTVTMAILGMFNNAYRLYSKNKRLTVATNLASRKISDFRTMTVDAIKAENPKSETSVVSGIQYALDWTADDVDVDGDSAADMVGDLVKIRLEVKWTLSDGDHRVSMTTMTTGKPE
jgi:Tfp pilus assembly protein PilV